MEKKERASPAEFMISEVQQRKKVVSMINCKFDLEIIFVTVPCSDKAVVFRGKSTEQRQEAAPSV